MIRFGDGALIYFWFLKGGAYSKQGLYQGQSTHFFFERQQHVKQRFDAYMTEGKKDWKGTFRHWILPPYDDWPRNRCKF